MTHIFNYRCSDIPSQLCVAVLYALLATTVLYISSADGFVSIIWPSSGLALAAALIGGTRLWPGIFVGALLGNMMAGNPFGIAFGISVGNTLEAVFAALLLNHTRFCIELSHSRDYLWLSLVSAVSALFSAISGNLVLLLSGQLAQPAFLGSLVQWWQGDFIGMLVITPIILVWRHQPMKKPALLRSLEAGACFGLAFVVGQSVFHQWFVDMLSGHLQSYWLFLFAAWAAVRFGRLGAALMIAMITAQALLGVTHMHSSLALNDSQGSLLNNWFFCLVITLVSISLALILYVHRQTTTELRKSESNLRSIIEHSNIPFMLNDGQQRITFLNNAFIHTFGYQLSDIPSLQQWREKAYPDEAYRQSVCAEWQTRLHTAKQKTLKFEPLEVNIRCRNGLMHSVIASASPLDNNDPDSQLVSLFDITELKRAEDDLAGLGNILESSLNEIYVFDAQSYRFIVVNRGARANLGYSMTELELLTPLDIKPEHSLASYAQLLEPLDKVRQQIDFKTVHRRKNGSCYDVEVRLQLMTFRQQPVYVASTLDITERKKAEEASQLASMVYQNISEAVMITDQHNKIIDVNPAFSLVTGYERDEVIGQNPNIRDSDRHDTAFYHSMWQQLKQSGYWQGEIWNTRKNGEVFPEWQTINTIYNEDGSVYRRVALSSDISKKKASEEQIWRQANFDTLTGLPNRRMFLNRLEHEISQAQRTGSQIAVLFIDLDRFKDVNDTLGHSVGDLLLKEAAIRLSSCIRESDTAARLGGDEFTVLLNNIGPAPAVERTIEQILQNFSNPFILQNEVLHISSSIGVVIYPDDGLNGEDLIKKADQAMYHAKENGRNRSCYFTATMQESIHNRMQLTSDLRVAIKEQQFLVYYQPIVELATGNIHKCEALIRWLHDSRGFVGPEEFIPIAEDTGLITDIGNWVFAEVTRQILYWRKQLSQEIQVSINKSPVEFYNQLDKDNSWANSLLKLGLPGHCIAVEITEGLLLDPAEHVIAEFNQLHDAGIEVSLDDFGTGYSSLAYLKKFDIDFLKIDKTFIHNLSPVSEDMALCEAIIVMAHKLGLKVIAEGVETQDQYDLLVKAGCDYGQGYLFSKALPAAEFESLLTAPNVLSL